MRNYHNIVKQILTDTPATRDDDMLLYATFLSRYSLVDPNETFLHVCCTARARKLPSYEGVSRARRKIQEDHKELRGTMRRRRMEEEVEYHEYYSTH